MSPPQLKPVGPADAALGGPKAFCGTRRRWWPP
jgi:hypothetical protein